MSTQKKGTTPPPLTLSARQNIAQVFEQYHIDKETENLISECYFEKRPKTYPQIYRRIYDLSRNSKLAFHVVSWCIAISFIQSLVPLLFNAAAIPLPFPLLSWIIGGVILGFFEYGQHQTLETLWTVYFQTKKVVFGIAFLTLLFSVISLLSSTYSAFILLSHSAYQYGLVAFALFVEFMILINSYNIHNYRQKTANTVKMLNDFGNGIDSGLYFHNQPIKNNSVQHTVAQVQVADEAKQIVSPSPSEIEKYGVLKNAKSPVLTDSNASQGKFWTLSQVGNFLKSYEGKIRNEGETFSRVANRTFFEHYKQNWELVSDGRIAPKVGAAERKQWFLEKYPKISAKLKATEK